MDCIHLPPPPPPWSISTTHVDTANAIENLREHHFPPLSPIAVRRITTPPLLHRLPTPRPLPAIARFPRRFNSLYDLTLQKALVRHPLRFRQWTEDHFIALLGQLVGDEGL